MSDIRHSYEDEEMRRDMKSNCDEEPVTDMEERIPVKLPVQQKLPGITGLTCPDCKEADILAIRISDATVVCTEADCQCEYDAEELAEEAEENARKMRAMADIVKMIPQED